MSWHIDCFVEKDKVFPVASYKYDDFLPIWQDIKNTLGRKQSGITMVQVECDDRPGKVWTFTSVEEAWEAMATFVVFS